MNDAPLGVKNADPKLAALGIALTQKPRYVVDMQFYDWISVSQHSLFYSQARTWQMDPPSDVIDLTARKLWRWVCREIIRVVDYGFDGETWWAIKKIYPLEDQRLAFLLGLMDFTLMLRAYNTGTHPVRSTQDALDVFKNMGEGKGFPIVSTGFEIFTDVICGHGWEQRFDAFIARAKKRQRG